MRPTCVKLAITTSLVTWKRFSRADSSMVSYSSCLITLRGTRSNTWARKYTDLPDFLLSQLASYVKERQATRLPFTRRSTYVEDLMVKHAAWLAEQDLPKPSVGGGRRWRGSFRSAGPSPASLGDFPSSFPSSPKTLALGTYSPRIRPFESPSEMLSPQMRATRGTATASPSVSPSLQPLHEGEEALFDMDGIDIAPTPPAQSRSSPSVPFPNRSPGLSGAPWQRLSSESKIPPLDLREIMAAEQEAGQQQQQRVRHGSTASRSSAELSQPIPFGRPSQRDRWRGVPLSSSPTSPGAGQQQQPWKAPVMTGWRVAEAAKASSLSSIQSEQLVSSRRSSAQHPHAGPSSSHDQTSAAVPRKSSPAAVTPSPQRSDDPASAVGAPVITPTRVVQPSTPLLARGVAPSPASRPKPASPWVNYTSASSFFTPSSQPQSPDRGGSEGAGGGRPSLSSSPSPGMVAVAAASATTESFSAIQQRQEDEGAALYKRGRTSLTEIIEERERKAAEQAKREEEEFMRWWEAESERVRAAEKAALSGAAGGAAASRGSGGAGRGRGKRGGGPSTQQQQQKQQRQTNMDSSSKPGPSRGGGGGGGKKKRGGNTKSHAAEATKTTTPTTTPSPRAQAAAT
jgi:hypothetical protein